MSARVGPALGAAQAINGWREGAMPGSCSTVARLCKLVVRLIDRVLS
ncbi:hypothetical protein HNR46_002142 [Haloferula luteola]|uniref:Uncharacterized protein n=1 Tax=Haloferula luteola TaxID=595692 RepID=A0A840V342_9BACT|nr:hypothetical protein [Haloferula luteola]MBB5351903.1 hypothetical protein [Haloferula luteola]